MEKPSESDLSVLRPTPGAQQNTIWCRPGRHEFGEETTISVGNTRYKVKVCQVPGCGYKLWKQL